MKILITGANGQLGRELTKLLNNHELLLSEIDTLDISDSDGVYSFIKKNKPSYVVNCGAYTAVDLCETNEEEAYKANAIGPKNLAMAIDEIGGTLIHISTDYVFDGDGKRDESEKIVPYVESDEPDPKSAYGRTKLAGENFVRENLKKHYIIRTAWLYGNGNNFVKTMIKLANENDKVTVVNDQFGSPTSTLELGKSIKHIIENDNLKYGVYHGTCEGSCSWYDFAKKIFEIKGIEVNLMPCTTEEFPRPAKRPKYSVLENKAFLENYNYKYADWKDGILEYLK